MLKKILTIVLSLTMMFTFSSQVFADDFNKSICEKSVLVENVEDCQTRKIDYEKNITIGKGDTWKKDFKVDSWWGQDHDAVNIIITQVTGSYKVHFLGDGVLLGSSKTYDDKGMIWTWTNLDPDKKYQVTIINTESNKTVDLRVQIESFVEK